MEPEPGFRDLLALFKDHKVKHIIVGAYALAVHGAPRMTGDLDILVEPTSDNATRVLAALEQFGFGSLGLTEADFEKPGQVIQVGMAAACYMIVYTALRD